MAPDPWYILSKYTESRIALGRAGGSMPTRPLLKFQLDHARARDAIASELNIFSLENQLNEINLPHIKLASKAQDRAEYLKRPDLGRRLNDQSGVLFHCCNIEKSVFPLFVW